jgi:steroid 5-alpha reductase family enzyme
MNIFLETLVISFVIQILFFTLAASFKTDKVTDLSCGLTFIILAWYVYLSSGNYFASQLLLVLMITAWGLRLAIYLFIRILKTGKDRRFDGIRENFSKFAKFWTFQAFAVWAIMLPSIYLLNLSRDLGSNIISNFGILVWVVGLTIETVADRQKFVFKNDPKNKGKWIESGIWKYSRHPNYFGEMMLWWGIFIFTLPLQSGLSWLTVAGPIFITSILLFVSGIPPLEKKYDERYKGNKDYQSYKSKTSILFPLPSKRN